MTATECPDHPGTRLVNGSCRNCAWHDSRPSIPDHQVNEEQGVDA